MERDCFEPTVRQKQSKLLRLKIGTEASVSRRCSRLQSSGGSDAVTPNLLSRSVSAARKLSRRWNRQTRLFHRAKDTALRILTRRQITQLTRLLFRGRFVLSHPMRDLPLHSLTRSFSRLICRAAILLFPRPGISSVHQSAVASQTPGAGRQR